MVINLAYCFTIYWTPICKVSSFLLSSAYVWLGKWLCRTSPKGTLTRLSTVKERGVSRILDIAGHNCSIDWTSRYYSFAAAAGRCKLAQAPSRGVRRGMCTASGNLAGQGGITASVRWLPQPGIFPASLHP